MKQQSLSTACNYGEACEMLRSGYVKHVRLSWNVGSDEFFRIASDWCGTRCVIRQREGHTQKSVECAIKAEPRTGSQLNACTFGARGKERRQRIRQFNPERESSLWLGKLPFREM